MEIMGFGIIKYFPLNESPQIFFNKRRVSAKDLKLDLELMKKRKAAFLKRVKQMVNYTSINTCRSVYINQYFGDSSEKNCGICDNCLKKKAGPLTTEEFGVISGKIEIALKEGKHDVRSLFLKLSGVNKDKAWKVIDFLQQEGKIKADVKGILTWK